MGWRIPNGQENDAMSGSVPDGDEKEGMKDVKKKKCTTFLS